jgi:hypothetical protein
MSEVRQRIWLDKEPKEREQTAFGQKRFSTTNAMDVCYD